MHWPRAGIRHQEKSSVEAGDSSGPESDIRAQHGEEDSHTSCSPGMECQT